jgi:hypothetical protein
MEGQQNQLIQMVGVSGGGHKSGLHSGSSTLKDKPLVVELFMVFFSPDSTAFICEVSALPTLSQGATLDSIFNCSLTLEQF